MSASNPSGPADFADLARQYWHAFGDFARQAGEGLGATSVSEGLQQAVDWWSRLAHSSREETNQAVEQFTRQARDWFGLMQDVAGQFAGRDASAADIARAWKQALGANGESPFPELFRGIAGPGIRGLQQWAEDASPYLQAWRKELDALLGLPTFGFAREHLARRQKLAQAQIDLQEKQAAYHALLARAGERAFEIFENRLAERSEPGRQIESARALFDLWIDAAEEAYAEVALSPEFRRVYGELVNAQMRAQAALQGEVEQMCRALGMPTRSEVASGHRKLHQLEREVRELKARLATIEGDKSTASPVKRAAAEKSAAQPAAKKASVAKKTIAKNTVKKTVKKTAARGRKG
ncbi:class III poly(R)-hydroxyalkanoic acid synthase subunit PhaE [Rehaibacterium terrae]|jgi:class III poly(R)-hydroxyalkanoic acid synthase PhaE subunit|uniref:Poly(3-hydroxyalkanoate) polymerase subunit PhaE n=1 Tax=Rehaibacterium terrae TaxID=1341696 RepID=A0A7W7Y2E8_9GAMM|nr:class III poly(R)-hydroxyalkanoic acid synthase subunit PhaE [Rehaibacterium terrae]MBB5016588.1 class III poly(R)-hydroxyalkanoic acid synthase PhaE subunit [Rehaibacterium terrae]